MTRERTSRPSSSVPIQWAELGGCRRIGRSMLLGLCGAIHGANKAKITNTATSAIPIEASTLRRPSVIAVVQVEEAFTIPSEARNPYGFKCSEILNRAASGLVIFQVLVEYRPLH